MLADLFKDDGFFGRNGTMQQINNVAGSIQASKSDNAIDRIQGLSQLIGKILAYFV